MVVITNGMSTFTVTKGAYEGIYKHQGYTMVHNYAGGTESEVIKNHHEEVTEAAGEDVDSPVDESAENNLIEKPIGQWTKAEVKQFAAENGISLEGTKNVNEAKEIVKEYIDNMK